ncbi:MULTISPECIES: restriction endonuclease [Pseudomonas syringae group]|uniref:restriction endonuclease n=1 Tax=Pseudomonas syringae group TaxID=136849 RepID=UPI0006B8920E|nr:restriction endonuclease [Pseudomonas syringae]MEE4083075.1 restriction endonuclease [Pseudomonas viridiflava]WHN05051.1 restriction endonuclease [Pseudomonas syringae pv. syringae]
MANFKSTEMRFLDSVFDMGGGFVLDFSNRTMDEFFMQELEIDISHEMFSQDGTSKARRVRCLLQNADHPTVARVLEALWKYRQTIRAESNATEDVVNAQGRFLSLLESIRSPGQCAQGVKNPFAAATVIDQGAVLDALKQRLYDLRDLPPQKRGYEFEGFLKELFDSSKLQARSPFSLVGEQIDGSFQLGNETYLIEAKWVRDPIGAAELHTFQGKLDQKAAWARGVFISYGGFTQEGLYAFGRGRKVICMSGEDIYKALGRRIPIAEVIERKVRAAAETGASFVPLDELFKS